MVLLYIMTELTDFKPDEKLYAISKIVLEIAQTALSDEELRFFDTYVSHGPPVEQAENLLVVYSSSIGPELTPTEGGGFSPGQAITTDLTEITIALRECTPGMDNKGRSPSTQELGEYALLTYTHALRIYCALKKARQPNGLLGCITTSPPSAQAIEEQGQRAGWDISITVEL